jgi:hypothetical protein
MDGSEPDCWANIVCQLIGSLGESLGVRPRLLSTFTGFCHPLSTVCHHQSEQRSDATHRGQDEFKNIQLIANRQWAPALKLREAQETPDQERESSQDEDRCESRAYES